MANVHKKNSYNNRKFLTFSDDPLRLKPRLTSLSKKHEDVSKLIRYVDDNIVGKNNAFYGPFGRRKVVFCDYTASGRSVQFLEDYILKEVLPYYGNTHSNTSVTSLQSALFRQEVRDIIRNAVNGSDQDAVIFAGHGCTGALQRLISALGLQEAPIVFVGHNEHHASLSAWREIGAKIIRILENKDGFLDLRDLEDKLQAHQNTGRQLIGCFCAVSNITGVISDDVACTLLLHQYGAIALWDYTIAAPSVSINMNPELQGDTSGFKDAIFFTGHKFIGGVQTPGILVAKKGLFKNCLAENVTSNKCTQELELREEGGTAAVVETIRAGLVMQLKETVGVTTIMQRAEKITKQMVAHIRTIPEVILLGNGLQSHRRLPIFSFMVRHPRGTFLHHNFVCAILNDVFGIQARSGCGCAGPYGQDVLGISADLAAKYENLLLEDMRLDRLQLKRCDDHSSHELLRPGFTRISLPYFMSEPEVAFVMEALKMVATEGWKLLPQYMMVPETGEWRHHTNSLCKDRKWLSSIRYIDGKMTTNERKISGPGVFPQTYQDCLQTARNLFNRARKTAHRTPLSDPGVVFDERSGRLRWFMLPNEAQDLLLGHSQNVKHDVPFDPAVSHRRSLISESNDLEMISISAPLSSNNSSPKHFSLNSLEEQQKFKNEVIANNGFQFNYDFFSNHVQCPNNINFAIGGNVSAVQGSNSLLRERCYSLNSVSPMLSPQTRASLGMHSRQRQCSCSSQTDLQSIDSDLNLSPTHSLSYLPGGGSISDCSLIGRGSPFCQNNSQDTDELQAYVEEVTKELATNIKSEIRGVISKVEDVLESTESIETSMCYMNNDRHGSGSEDGRSDSISVNEVAEYIVEISKNMANEVKSEIRDVVSAVDVFIAPDGPEKSIYSRASSVTGADQDKLSSGAIPKRLSPVGKRLSADNASFINKSNSATRLNESDDPNYLLDDKKKLWPMIGSISSQDSGINLSFHEQEYSASEDQQRSSSECSGSRKLQKSANTEKLKQQLKDFSMCDELVKWHVPPKNIWNSALEALEEFNMIKDGDKVMVCISGSHDSISLLHVLHHYQDHVKCKNLNFTIGAAIVTTSENPNHPLLSYLETIGVQYVFQEPVNDASKDIENKLNQCSSLTSICSRLKCGQLLTTAKNSGYNVLAVSQHLDDLAEDFLLSLFHNGRLQSMKAHFTMGDGIRVIRPFIYVREKVLKQFAEIRNLPVMVENLQALETPKERHRTKQLLAQQEILFPSVFRNVRKALQPLLRATLDPGSRPEIEMVIGKRPNREDPNSISIYIESDTDDEPVFLSKRV